MRTQEPEPGGGPHCWDLPVSTPPRVSGPDVNLLISVSHPDSHVGIRFTSTDSRRRGRCGRRTRQEADLSSNDLGELVRPDLGGAVETVGRPTQSVKMRGVEAQTRTSARVKVCSDHKHSEASAATAGEGPPRSPKTRAAARARPQSVRMLVVHGLHCQWPELRPGWSFGYWGQAAGEPAPLAPAESSGQLLTGEGAGRTRCKYLTRRKSRRNLASWHRSEGTPIMNGLTTLVTRLYLIWL
jgi:hypothetical protein